MNRRPLARSAMPQGVHRLPIRQSCDPVAATAPESPALLAGAKIGLLGGSFNPAHDGHLHISLEALKRLDLDFVWWMVSPQNPLKSQRGMAPFSLRFSSALFAARHPRILVTDIECRLHTQYTADTIKKLAARFPRTRFVWMMGADNLVQFTQWERWQEIVNAVPVAVFDRPRYSHPALTARMARQLRHDRRSQWEWKGLTKTSLPAWAFITCPQHPESATRIREGRHGGPADFFI